MRAVPLHTAATTTEAGPLHGRFMRRTALPTDDGQDRLVRRAVRRAQQGDRDAIRFLYVRYADNVYGYVRSMLQDDHEAEDVTQQVFAKLMTALGKYSEQQVPFSAWILRVARNVALDHRRQRRAISCEEVRGSHEFDETAHDRAQSLHAALESLPTDQREVLVLRHIIGMAPGEIARSLGRSEASVHGLHHRGRAALKRALIEFEAAPTTAANCA
jgi:RNA polymerase sigma-70 factor, ECF subfamily